MNLRRYEFVYVDGHTEVAAVAKAALEAALGEPDVKWIPLNGGSYLSLEGVRKIERQLEA